MSVDRMVELPSAGPATICLNWWMPSLYTL
jgi:hypothetical protein